MTGAGFGSATGAGSAAPRRRRPAPLRGRARRLASCGAAPSLRRRRHGMGGPGRRNDGTTGARWFGGDRCRIGQRRAVRRPAPRLRGRARPSLPCGAAAELARRRIGMRAPGRRNDGDDRRPLGFGGDRCRIGQRRADGGQFALRRGRAQLRRRHAGVSRLGRSRDRPRGRGRRKRHAALRLRRRAWRLRSPAARHRACAAAHRHARSRPAE